MARTTAASNSDPVSIPDDDCIHQNRRTHVDICESQEPRENRLHTNMEGCDYDWDNGPLELLPLGLAETDYNLDRGPYSPAAFLLDGSDPLLGVFSTDTMS